MKRSLWAFGVLFLTSIGAALVLASVVDDQTISMPYDSTNLIIYDNDETVDVYTDEYLMALASAGDIELAGMITTSSVAPYNRYVSRERYEKMVDDRLQGVIHARNSGLRNIPDPIRGIKGHLKKPPSGRIENTLPIGSAGSRLIVAEAHKASPEKPLVVVVGGPLTTVADAYLLDNSIADKVIVAYIGASESMSGYNGWADPWAGYIALQRLRLVLCGGGGATKPAWLNYVIMFLQKTPFIQFPYAATPYVPKSWRPFIPFFYDATPYVPKSWIATLPDTPLRQWMIDKKLPFGNLPGNFDADGPAAITVTRGDYVLKVQGVSFDHWTTIGGHETPIFRKDPDSRAVAVKMARKDVATDEWWRALTNPAAYHAQLQSKP